MVPPMSCRANLARNVRTAAIAFSDSDGSLAQCLLESLGHLSLCRLQHLLSVHILPPSFANIDCTHSVIAGHQADSIRETTIVSRAFGLCPLEIVENI